MLKLKSETKQLFIDAGLEELTVGRDTKGYLSLIGKECNQPILSIGSVQVSNKLSKVESEIVINEYLTPTLTTHAKEVRAYLDMRKAINVKNTALEKQMETLYESHGIKLIITKHYRDCVGKIIGIAFNKFKTVETTVNVVEDPDSLELRYDFRVPLTKIQAKEVLDFVSKNSYRTKALVLLYEEIEGDRAIMDEAFNRLQTTCSF